MGQQPHCQACRTLAARGIWRSVVEVTIYVENMNVLSTTTGERLSCSNHNTAIAADQQRNLSWFLQVRSDAVADAVPRDPRPRPAPDRGDRVMGKIAGNCNVAVIERFTAGGLQTCENLGVAISLRVILIAWI